LAQASGTVSECDKAMGRTPPKDAKALETHNEKTSFSLKSTMRGQRAYGAARAEHGAIVALNL
jgi:hypothetical protein